VAGLSARAGEIKGAMKLSEHFDLSEFTHSQTADRNHIDNTPPSYILPKLMLLAQGMEKVRSLLGDKPITISSGYRCDKLNSLVGSRPTSQHTLGIAADFICPAFGSPEQIVRAIVNGDLEYDQVIQEFATGPGKGWVHISFSERKRMQALVIDSSGTKEFA
jgi:zinc D-Ala-D-Ala carboxypeptidase